MDSDTAQPLPQRRSIRLRGFDYRDYMAYFITICTADRQEIFGRIVEGELRPSRRGLITQECLAAIPIHQPYVELDAWVVMPNHVHAILCFVGDGSSVGATHASPVSDYTIPRPTGPKVRSLGAVVGSFKSAVTKHVNRLRPGAGNGLWQRNYYDHIIRNDRAFDLIRDYIIDNPRNWESDEHNPAATHSLTFARWLDEQAAGDACVAPTKDKLP